MEKKLLIQDIAEAISTKSGISRKDSEAFVKALFETIEQGLTSDKFVKIKGLGTFKVIAVGERESININTGERFSISGHDKITFTPETSLKELVNRPFSHFQTVILNDETDIEELEEVDKLSEILPEEPHTPDEEVEETETKFISDSPTDQRAEKSSTDYAEKLPNEATSIVEHDEKSSETDNANEFSSLTQDGISENSISQQNALECSQEETNEPIESEECISTNDNIGSDSDTEGSGDGIANSTERPNEENDSDADCINNEKQSEETEESTEGDTTHKMDESQIPEVSCTETTPVTETVEKDSANNQTATVEEDKASEEEQENLNTNFVNETKRTKKGRSIWKTITIVCIAIMILLLTYFAGYFKVFCPCEIWNGANDTGSIPKISPIAEDSICDFEVVDSLENDSTTVQIEQNTINDTIANRSESEKNEISSQDNDLSSSLNLNDATKDVNSTSHLTTKKYKQVDGGRYEITGTLRTHKIKKGETIRTIAQEVYGSKGYATYIITHNELANPNLIDTGMVLKLPKLRKK